MAEVWHLKDIKFGGRELRIITQNFNGCGLSHYVLLLP